MANSYFVFFNDQSVAAAAAQCSLFPEGAVDAFRVMAAPGPEEVQLSFSAHFQLSGILELGHYRVPWPSLMVHWARCQSWPGRHLLAVTCHWILC